MFRRDLTLLELKECADHTRIASEYLASVKVVNDFVHARRGNGVRERLHVDMGDSERGRSMVVRPMLYDGTQPQNAMLNYSILEPLLGQLAAATQALAHLPGFALSNKVNVQIGDRWFVLEYDDESRYHALYKAEALLSLLSIYCRRAAERLADELPAHDEALAAGEDDLHPHAQA